MSNDPSNPQFVPAHSSLNDSAPSYEEDYSVANTQPTRSEAPNRKLTAGIVGGAAVVGGVAGLVLVGPLVAVVGAGAAAGAALSGNKIARGAGGVAADVGSSAAEFNKNHGVVDKTGNALNATGNALKGSFRWVSSKFNKDGNGEGKPSENS